jgi:hypothetical protein
MKTEKWPMQRNLRYPVLLAAAVLAACGESATGTNQAEGLSATEARLLAAEFGAQDAAVLGGFGTPAFSVSADGSGPRAATSTTEFTRTRSCPRGGSVTLQGTRVHTGDRETRTATHQFTATRTENDCAFAARDGGTMTIDGNPNTRITASHAVTNGVPGVGTGTKKGSFTWARSGGATGTCAVDLTQTFDPATRTFTLKGTFCGQTVDLTRTWTD